MVVNIFGAKVSIEFKQIPDEMGLAGYYDYTKLSIVVDSRLKGDAKISTILHECLHGCFHRMSYRQSIPHALEEVMIDQISNFLVENFDIKFKKRIK